MFKRLILRAGLHLPAWWRNYDPFAKSEAIVIPRPAEG